MSALYQYFFPENADLLDMKLAEAVFEGNADKVSALLGRGAYVNAVRLRDTDAFPTPDFPNVRAADLHDMSAQEPACGRVIQHAYERRDVAVMDVLLKAGAELRFTFVDNNHPASSIVLDAAAHNIQNMLHFFVSNGVDLNTHRSFDGNWTAMYWACGHARTYASDVIDYMVTRGAHVDVQSGDMEWKTTNAHACVVTFVGGDCVKNLRELMRHGVDINVYAGVEEWHESVLQTVIQEAAHPIVDDSDARREMLREIARLVLGYNVDFDFHDLGNAIPSIVEDPVIRARIDMKQNEQSVAFLREMAPERLDDQDQWKKTALHRAAENGQFAQVRTLLLRGASDNIRDKWHRRWYESARHRREQYEEKLEDGARFSNNPETPYRFARSEALTRAKIVSLKIIQAYAEDMRNMAFVQDQYDTFRAGRWISEDNVARLYYRLPPELLQDNVHGMLLGEI